MAEVYDWEAEGSFIYDWEQERADDRDFLSTAATLYRGFGNLICLTSIALAAKVDIELIRTTNDLHQKGQLDDLAFLAGAALLGKIGFNIRNGAQRIEERAQELV